MRENNILKSLLKYICITISASFVFVIPALSVASGYTGGSVDLGTLTWSFKEDGIYMGTITDKQQGLSNLYIDKTTYTLGTSTDTLTDNQYVGNATTNNIYIKNTTVSDATALQTALNGITLYYQRTTDTSWYPPVIKIATTKYVEDKFASSVSELNTTIGTIKNVVDNTIIQADRIGKLHTGKQNRPDDYNTNEKCPDNAICLLITEADGSLHWYPICNGDGSLFNVTAFIARLPATIPATPAGNDGIFYRNDRSAGTAMRKGASANGAFGTTTTSDITLSAGEWRVKSFYYGTIYGTSACNSTSGTYAVASNDNQTDSGGQYCWCKMTDVSGTDDVKHSVAGDLWVYIKSANATWCTKNCSMLCAMYVRTDASLRSALIGDSN